MKKIGITIIILLSISSIHTVCSQSYDSAVGLRFSNSITASYKQSLTSRTAFDALAGLRLSGDNDTFLAGLFYEINNQLDLDEIQLQWYYGAGALLSLGNNNTAIAPAGIIGIEWTAPSTPINVFIDAIPAIYIGDSSDFDISVSAGVRYVLNR